MRSKGANTKGRFAVEIEVVNRDDMVQARLGLIPDKQVRRMKLSGVVDPGATRLVLPRKVVDQLGLPVTEKVKFRYADGRTRTRDLVDDVFTEVQGRHRVFSAIVEPNRKSALIGAIVLEDLDFLVDCTQQKLVPRDPRYIVSEIE
jgi:predicted aspartyl protease